MVTNPRTTTFRIVFQIPNLSGAECYGRSLKHPSRSTKNDPLGNPKAHFEVTKSDALGTWKMWPE